MNNDFNGKKVLVTGASSGIGFAAALGFAQHGADVAFSYNSNKKGADDLAGQIQKLGRACVAVKADLLDEKEVEGMFEKVLGEFGGRLDVLVNNAGTMVQRVNIADCPTALWEKIIDVNLRSVFFCCRRVAKLMATQKYGRIINVTSVSARNGGAAGATPYATSKGAVSTFTRGFAKEMAPHRVTVNGVAPGVIDTPFHERFTPKQLWEKLNSMIPLGTGKPEDCTGAILFLASDAAHYITGEIIEVNGGMLMD